MTKPKHNRDPWMKFYPQDWRADEKLRMCSLAARGLWIEMLAIMHRSERYGQLLISGVIPTDAQLAVQVGAPPDQVTSMLGELETAGVFSRATKGVIYSRRMTRDRNRSEIARKNGRNGGNPTLSKQKAISGLDNQPDKPKDKGQDKPHKPEARSQSTGETSSPERAREALPDWLPPDEWAGFVEMRRRTKAPLTARARTLAIERLAKLRDEGQSPAAVLDQSTMRSWKGLFPVDAGRQQQPEPRGGSSGLGDGFYASVAGRGH